MASKFSMVNEDVVLQKAPEPFDQNPTICVFKFFGFKIVNVTLYENFLTFADYLLDGLLQVFFGFSSPVLVIKLFHIACCPCVDIFIDLRYFQAQSVYF